MLAAGAQADTVLTYTGNATSDPFIVQFYPGHGYNPCGCALTASFTLAGAPTPGGSFDKFAYVPESWLVSVNGNVFTQNNSTLSLDFSFVNDAVALWDFSGSTPSGLNFASYSYDLFEATDYGPGMGEQGNRGTWAVVTTPEPGTLALLGVGLVGLLARRRWQAKPQRVARVDVWEPLAEDRAIPGHWEGDLLSGGKNSYIATLVERHSRFLMLIKVPSKETKVVVAALSQRVRKLPTTLKRSLTWDRGLEMAKHKDFTVATDVQVYFCDPQSPWQRGTNENTNLLLRQYFPRGTDLSPITQAQLDQVSLRLNQRPRKTLGFQTPAGKLRASVASTI